MAGIEDKVGSQRPVRVQPPVAAGSGGPKPADKPTEQPGAHEPASDQAKLVARPQTDAERQAAVLAAVRNAQKPPADPEPGNDDPGDKTVPQKVAENVGTADGVREGVRVATNLDEIKSLPLLGRLVEQGGRVGGWLGWLANSRFGLAIKTALEGHKIIAPIAKFLGRIAPVAGLAVGSYDVYDAVRTVRDKRPGTQEKVLSVVKGTFSAISGLAGMATLLLAPTGVGAAIAGGIALAAGALSFGTDLWLGHVRKQRQDNEKRYLATHAIG